MRALADEHEDDVGLYVHFPYCVQKCPYCDFNSYTHKKHGDTYSAYTAAVLAELDARLPRLAGRRLHSVFFGGGTPSLWTADAIGQILHKARTFFGERVSAPLEVTLEANPGTVERGRLGEMKAAGVNRVSMGVQALDDKLLKTLGRIHSADEAIDSLREIQALGFDSHSIDFMYGIPEQTPEAWKSAIGRALSLETPHVSAYNLIYEPGTLMHAWRAAGDLSEVAEDDEVVMFDTTSDLFALAGYSHYEVSNFAKPGHESVHNSLYWRGQPYLGVGAGACSCLPLEAGGIERTESLRNPDDYIAAWTGARRGLALQRFEQEEQVTPAQRADEHVLLGLRTRRGWDAARTERELAVPALRVALDVSESHRQWCTFDGARLKPTRTGYLMNNALIMACVERLGGNFRQ